MSPRFFLLAVAGLLGAVTWLSSRAETPAAGPRILVLGTAQDGGFPQTGCACTRCSAARRDPARSRAVASLALILPETNERYLFDATPDLPAQIEKLRPYRSGAPERIDRGLISGVFLTHAHMGHYTGLAHLGYESMHTKGIPAWGTQRMVDFLAKNAPWDQLVRLGNVQPRALESGQAVALGQGVTVTPLSVPHRAEYTDTFGYKVKGPRRTLLYIPDTDPWRKWSPSILEALVGVDVALLDATFYSGDELPDRNLAEIGHPLIVDSMETLGPLVAAGKLEVFFTHLNHSNPALDGDSEARRNIEKRGFHVLADGQVIEI
ncbi:MAG TPA: MBL fold metallo-hydrolase [Thermoanaerobaculia bacterium]|nr:MBL fold metallo-hydrolase [Thermoanaerobaculia bacterium]